ncbi:sugar ABC transporter substrate-binding protein [Lentzea sp. NBRC 105346]|uniref:ABC transporter substrate-binding protein n=1 Tax=Lentzea sp. NBRC 105346 TaxID=3032205 RepID=UPI0024A0170A|nr:ABC transporter substrate-binding protein [Lentzea sp. NBRC 105346]GLZ29494.1 sugar ABC transporter substrate-binding protein [Lentzea sp. NBRC 105346]
MKLYKVVSLVLGTTLVAAGCGGGDSASGPAEIKFVWWGNDDRAKLTNEAVQLFQERNKDIKVTTSFQNFQTYFEKLSTEIAGGNAPDVIQMDYRYLNEYAGRNVLLDLTPYVGKQLRTADWNQGFVGSGKLNDKQVALPLAQNATTIVYDPKLFADAGVAEPKIGWSWADYKDAAGKIQAKSDNKIAGSTDFGGTEDVFETWLRQHGKKLYEDNGKLGYTKADLKAFWQLSKDFRDAKATTSAELVTTLNAGAEQTPLGKKLSASEHSYDSLFGGYDKVRPGELKLGPYPSDSKDKLGSYRKPSQLISVSSRTKNKDAAVKLVDFLLNDPDAGKILGANRGLPANLKIRDQVAQNLTGVNKAIFEYEKSVDASLGDAPPAPPKGDGAIYKLMQRKHEEVVFGKTSLDQAVEDFFSEAERVLS